VTIDALTIDRTTETIRLSEQQPHPGLDAACLT